MKKFILISILLLGVGYISYAQNRTVGETNRIVKLYPNPASTYINLDFQKNFDPTSVLVVYNFMGRKVFEFRNTAYRNNINLSNFYRGVYIYQLRDKNGAVIESGKFQVLK